VSTTEYRGRPESNPWYGGMGGNPLRPAIALGEDWNSRSPILIIELISDREPGGTASVRQHGLRFALSDVTVFVVVVAITVTPLSAGVKALGEASHMAVVGICRP